MLSFAFVRKAVLAAAGCAALFAPSVANAGATQLTLINGWTNGAFGAANASVQTVKGVVHFKGAIATSDTNPEPFVLPPAFRPPATVYTKVDLCNSHNGRLEIDPSGDVFVEVENGDFSQAQCFTSLDSATFSLTSDNYKPFNLKHGWKGGPFSTAEPAGKVISGVVHLEGAMATKKTNTDAFTLPAKFRPQTEVYAPVDMCGATNGRLIIDPSGTVNVEAETDFANAQCFTSLDGVQFAVGSKGYAPLSLINSWTNAPFGTRNAAVRVLHGVVQFEGAIATTGSNSQPFVLPAGFRPSTETWIPVDMCDATNGRLDILTDGTVFVETQDFSNAQCFTSLEGASFHL